MFGSKKSVAKPKAEKASKSKDKNKLEGAGLSLQSNGLFYVEVRGTRSGYKVTRATKISSSGSVDQDHITNFNNLDNRFAELAKSVKFSTPVCVGIPFRDFQSKILEFPDMEKENALESLRMQFGSAFSGLTEATALYDIFKLDFPNVSGRGDTAQYLAIATRKDVISRLQNSVSYVRMTTAAIEPGEIAMARALGDVADAGKVFWMSVWVAGDSIHMTTMYDDNPIQFRVTVLNGQGDERINGLPDIIRSQVQMMESTGMRPERVVICGDLSLDAVEEEIQSQLNAEIVTAGIEDMWPIDAGGFDLTGFECAMALAMR